MWIVSVPSHLAVVIAIVVAVRRAKTLHGPTDTHGSAHWAERQDLEAADLLRQEGPGVYIGAWPDSWRLLYLRHARPQHVARPAWLPRGRWSRSADGATAEYASGPRSIRAVLAAPMAWTVSGARRTVPTGAGQGPSLGQPSKRRGSARRPPTSQPSMPPRPAAPPRRELPWRPRPLATTRLRPRIRPSPRRDREHVDHPLRRDCD
jgi:hypothetical protein